MVCPCNKILFSLKKEWSSDTCYNMKLEDIVLSEINQTQKDKFCTIPPMWGVCWVGQSSNRKTQMSFFGQPNRKVRFTDTEMRLEVAGGWGAGRGGMGRGVPWGQSSSVEGGCDGCVTVWTCFMPLSCTLNGRKAVHFMFCVFYPPKGIYKWKSVVFLKVAVIH